MSMKKHFVIAATLMLGISSLTPATGAAFVYDRFSEDDYNGGNQIQFLDAGAGWSENWSAGSGASYQSTDYFGSYPPDGGSSDRIGGAANKAATEAGDVSRLTTDLSSYFEAGDSVWFSYLVSVRGDFDGQFDMGFASGASSDSGIGISVSGEQMYGRVDGALSPNSLSVPLSGEGFNTNGDNLSFFVVGEFVKGSTPDSDSLRIWVNEGADLPNAATFTFSDFSLAAIPDRFGFNTLASTSPELSNIALWFDEIQMGTTMDSIGVIPEPSTVALCGLGGLLVLRRRRHRGGVGWISSRRLFGVR